MTHSGPSRNAGADKASVGHPILMAADFCSTGWRTRRARTSVSTSN